MKMKLQFALDSVMRNSRTQPLLVHGTCQDGPIYVADTFVCATRVEARLREGTYEHWEGPSRPINLAVRRILVAGREVHFCSPSSGSKYELHLEPEALVDISKGDILLGWVEDGKHHPETANDASLSGMFGRRETLYLAGGIPPGGMKRRIQIGIDLIPPQQRGNMLIVPGRCHFGPITLGQAFSQARSVTFRHRDGEDEMWEGPARVVEVVVRRIVAYGHDIETCYSGLTAEFEMESLIPFPIYVSDNLTGWVDDAP